MAALEIPADLESQVRNYMLELMPLEHAPAHLRLAFHDAGTYDRRTGTGGANGTIHLPEELRRAANSGWGHACVDLLVEVKAAFPDLSWADLVAVGAAAAIVKCGGPALSVGLGRTDGLEPAAPHRLPGGYEGSRLLRSSFDRMGLDAHELVVLSGAHTLGHTQRRPFTTDAYTFSNSYFVELLTTPERSTLPSDQSLLADPELRQYVEQYASDEALFLSDFGAAFRKLTWLGNSPVG